MRLHTLSFVILAAALIFLSSHVIGEEVVSYTIDQKLALRERVRVAFYHAYNGYNENAFPNDSLRPLSCDGFSNFGNLSATLIDSMDMLAILNNYTEFMRVVHYVSNISFNLTSYVSVFETNIRIVGGLISAHYMATKVVKYHQSLINFSSLNQTEKELFSYNGELLERAKDLTERLMPSFNTPLGIPVTRVNLSDSSLDPLNRLTTPAEAGTLTLELGYLSALTDNCSYYQAAKKSTRAIFKRRGLSGLLGSLIDVDTGDWKEQLMNIGANTDSFFEYLAKGYVAFNDDELLQMWIETYESIQEATYIDGWYYTIAANDPFKKRFDETTHSFGGLQAFWPALQVEMGELVMGLDSYKNMKRLSDDFGFLPESIEIAKYERQEKNSVFDSIGYYLRPEYIESTFFLYQTTKDDIFIRVGERFLNGIEKLRTSCGFAAVKDLNKGEREDSMESFFLSETLKYLYLLFTPLKEEYAVAGRDIEKEREWLMYDPEFYVLTTEAHPLPISLNVQKAIQRCSNKMDKKNKYDSDSALDRENTKSPTEVSQKTCPVLDYMMNISEGIGKLHIEVEGRNTTEIFDNDIFDLKYNSNKHLVDLKIQYQVFIDKDPLVPFSTPVSFFVNSIESVSVLALQAYRAKPISGHYGVVSISALEIDNSFLQPESVALVRFKSRSALVGNTSSPLFHTSSSAFMPDVCATTWSNWISEDVPERFFESTVHYAADNYACSVEGIGNVSSLKRPFAIIARRGQCMFKEKAIAAQDVGASALIVVNNVDERIVMGDVNGEGYDIPVVIPTYLTGVETEQFIRQIQANPDEFLIEAFCPHNMKSFLSAQGIAVVKVDGRILFYRERLQLLVRAHIAAVSEEGCKNASAPKESIVNMRCSSCILEMALCSARNTSCLQQLGSNDKGVTRPIMVSNFLSSKTNSVIILNLWRNASEALEGKPRRLESGYVGASFYVDNYASLEDSVLEVKQHIIQNGCLNDVVKLSEAFIDWVREDKLYWGVLGYGIAHTGRENELVEFTYFSNSSASKHFSDIVNGKYLSESFSEGHALYMIKRELLHKPLTEAVYDKAILNRLLK